MSPLLILTLIWKYLVSFCKTLSNSTDTMWNYISQLHLVAGKAANRKRQQPAGESRTHGRVTWSVVGGNGREGSGGRVAEDLKDFKKKREKEENRTGLVSIESQLGWLLSHVLLPLSLTPPPSYPIGVHYWRVLQAKLEGRASQVQGADGCPAAQQSDGQ